MNIAYFRKYPNSENIEISFHYKNASIGIEREFNLNRNFDETIEQSLDRIKINLEKEFRKKSGNKKKKVKQNEASEQANNVATDISVALLDETRQPIKEIKWSDLFKTEQAFKADLILQVIGQDYSIAYNFPYVKQLTLPSVLMNGFDCYPAKIEVHFAERDDCLFEWFRGLPKEKDDIASKEWTKCGESFFYKVKESNVRHKLKVIISFTVLQI